MSNRDKNMFRNEQRFSFRKYSFGLASALIANVVFGATIAGGPVVHANTESEATTVTSSSSVQLETLGNSTETSVTEEVVATPEVRNVSLTYTVKVVDKEGAVLKTEVRTVDVTTSGEDVSAFAELGEDLVPTDYKLIAGLGQVLVYENQDNIFTVTVEKVVTEPVVESVSQTSKSEASATVESSEVTNVSSETALKASSEAVKNLNSVTETVPSSEAPVEDSAMSETMVAPAPIKVTEAVTTNTNSLSALALLAYEVRYTDSEGQVVGKTAGLVTAESKDGVATKEVNFSANDIPSGYELAVGQSSVLTKQLVENQINILSFAVVKKSEEEEIAESLLANKEVLEQVVSEADLLADEALRQVAKEQVGNTSLEAAAQETKEVAKEAQAILNDSSATQEVVDTTVETVKASTLALADEMLKVDEDSVLTAQLAVSSTNSATVSTNATYNVSFYEDMNSRVPDYVRVSNISVNGQTITYEFIVNEINSTGYGKAYHEFALGNEVDTTSVTIVRQQRSDANSAWVDDGSWNAGTWVGGERQYFSRSNGNILGALYPYNNARDNTTGVEVDAANINDQVGTLYRDQLDVTTRAYKYTITATARDGKKPANMAFMAGFRAGTDNRAYYVATPGVTDPVNQAPEFNNPAGRQTTPTDIYVWKDTPMRTEADLSVVTNGATINEIYFVEDETTTRTGDGLTVSTEGKVSGQTNLAVGTHNVDSIINYDNSSEVRSGDRFWIAVMDAVKTADVTKSLGDTYDANSLATEVLNNVEVQKGNIPENWGSADAPNADWVTTKTIVDPATGAETTVPTTPGTHEVTVRVTNNQGRYKDVVVNVTIPNPNQATTATDKKPLYVFNNTAIKTVDPGTNVDTSTTDDKVNVVTLVDPQDINSVAVTRESDVGTAVFNPASIGITIDTDGNASGTPKVDAIGVYSRGLTVTDGTGATTNLFPRNNEMETYVLDATAGATITKAVGESVTEAEILDNVTVVTGNSNTMDAAIDTRYRKVLAPGQQVPTTAGTHTVMVRVITESNVYKDVPITVVIPENPATTGTNKKPLYVFNNTPIATVGDGTNVADTVNKVNVVTLADPQGINSVEVTRESNTTAGSFSAAPIGITIDTEGNASGTPSVGAIGVYSRGLTVTDGTGATTNLFPRNNEMETYILDATAGATITKAVGESVTEAEILDNVTVATGNSNTMDAAIDTRYRKVLAPNQTVPTTAGTHTVIVRVITESNVYKDVPVTVIIPSPQTDGLNPAYAEKTVVPGTPATSTPTFTDASGQPITAPAGARYEIPADFQAPVGYTAEIDPNTGVVTVTAADGTTVESIEVPVKVTYTDGSTDNTTAVFKLDTDGDGTPDTTDTDDDNDNVPDVDENTDNTNPKNPDTDGDGITDGTDNVPSTPNVSTVNVDNATVLAGKEITPIPVAVTTDDTQATVAVTGLPAG
ncbi:TPA: YPDG domain-containing protein, partial [Streptococcus suis]|nr:YPDG domain-containing protein [Streptococcus suis]